MLRGEWGFTGAVVSDWGAVSDRVTALAAGLDLEMPGNDGRTDQQIVDAVRRGDLDESVVDEARGAATQRRRAAMVCSVRPPWSRIQPLSSLGGQNPPDRVTLPRYRRR